MPLRQQARNVAYNAMTTSQIQELIDSLQSKDVWFDNGLTEQETLQVQQKFEFIFPSDLKQFLQTALPVSKYFYNWRKALSSKEETDRIHSMFAWTLDGMLFDIEHNNFWYENWGQRPDSSEEKIKIASHHYVTYPKLIPVFSHRYMPSRPSIEGNPVLSVHQMDIIYYGNDLVMHFANEFHFV
jgi:hypothetical protein